MVEWKKLGDVCAVLNGFSFKSQDYSPTGVRVIRISDVQSGYISDKDKVYYPVEKVDEFKKYILNEGDIVMSLTGNPGRVAIIENDSLPCALNQRVACLRVKSVIGPFLFYLFNCKDFESIALANSTGGAQKNLSTTWLNNYKIPIPSLTEQTRIVGILDTFTASIENLKQQIAQRRKQYEHYRNQLLDLEGKEGVEMKTLGEACKIERGVRVVKKDLEENGDVPVFQNSLTPLGYYVKSNNKGGTPFVIVGGAAGDIGYSDIPFWAADDCLCINESDSVVGKYIYAVLQKKQHYLKSQVRKAGVPRLSRTVVEKLSVSIPSLPEQQRIVSILDTFEASIANLEQQLAQRERQYEYYRNQLLTFKMNYK